jgi:hypothetical protein
MMALESSVARKTMAWRNIGGKSKWQRKMAKIRRSENGGEMASNGWRHEIIETMAAAKAHVGNENQRETSMASGIGLRRINMAYQLNVASHQRHQSAGSSAKRRISQLAEESANGESENHRNEKSASKKIIESQRRHQWRRLGSVMWLAKCSAISGGRNIEERNPKKKRKAAQNSAKSWRYGARRGVMAAGENNEMAKMTSIMASMKARSLA